MSCNETCNVIGGLILTFILSLFAIVTICLCRKRETEFIRKPPAYETVNLLEEDSEIVKLI